MKKTTLILALFLGLSITAQESNYKLKNLDSNTKYSDFGVSYVGDNEAIFASSRTTKVVRTALWDNTLPFLDLFKGILTNEGQINNVSKLSKEVNTKFHESNVAFTKDMKTVYFCRNNYIDNKFTRGSNGYNLIQMYKATVGEDGEWTNIVSMPFNNDNYQTGHPALNKDDTKLYFTSDMPGAIGETDIFVVDLNPNEDGTFGVPRNLGPNVNTEKKEMFPFIDDNDVLYFSSDGYENGKGGLDIFKANTLELNTEGASKNLGEPINSDKDDFSLIFQEGMRSGHFSSNRAGGKGDDDIYYFSKCNTVEGVVSEKVTNKLIPGARVDLFNERGVLLESVIADEDAKFSFKNMDCNVADYKVEAIATGYELVTQTFTNDKDVKLGLELTPEPVVTDTPVDKETVNSIVKTDPVDVVTIRQERPVINIDIIYFDLDKSYIRPDAEHELEKVLTIMNDYPKLKVELGSHTDSRASDYYNWNLSNKRAKATKKWLVDRGIESSRIRTIGFGETELVNECSNGVKCSKSQHQLNRRTEFVILNPDSFY